MENEVLDWAEIRCTKQVPSQRAGGRPVKVTNSYMIALDIRDISEEFICPCCGKSLSYEVTFKGNLSKEKKIKLVRESRGEGLRYLKAFKYITALIAAASAVGMLTSGAVSFGLAGLVILTFLFIWLPGLFLLINKYNVLRDKNNIIDAYIKENPVTVTLIEPDESTHRFEDFPEIPVLEDSDAGYGLE